MKKNSRQEEFRQETAYTRSEYDQLRDGMKKYPLKRIDGKLRGGWEQYMEELNVLSFQPDGSIAVINPLAYTRWSEVSSRIDYADFQEFKSILVQFPEEREAWTEKLKQFGEKSRSLIKSVVQ